MTNYYVLEYETGEDFVNRRAPYRDEHLGAVRDAQARGEVVMGGALGEPPQGAMLIFRADTPAVVEAFARGSVCDKRRHHRMDRSPMACRDRAAGLNAGALRVDPGHVSGASR